MITILATTPWVFQRNDPELDTDVLVLNKDNRRWVVSKEDDSFSVYRVDNFGMLKGEYTFVDSYSTTTQVDDWAHRMQLPRIDSETLEKL